MNRYPLHKWLLIISLIMEGCACTPPTALDIKWPDYKRLRRYGDGTAFYLSAPVRKGYVLTNNRDTIKGYIKINNYNNALGHLSFVPVLPFGKAERSDIILVRPKDIDYIRVEVPGSKDSLDFGILDSDTWRVLARKDPVRIYYQQWWENDIDGILTTFENITLTAPGVSIRIPLSVRGEDSRSYCLVHFINKRYGQHFRESEFTGQRSMLNYILDKENERVALSASADPVHY
jgi:hypothetical protein